jgi:hypothetical protein
MWASPPTDAGGCAATGAPQTVQNFAFSFSGDPQDTQNFGLSGIVGHLLFVIMFVRTERQRCTKGKWRG